MKNDRKGIDEGKITGFFDKDTQIEGDLRFKGFFRIDGYFKGKIESESTLIIGNSGKVEADVDVGLIIIDGEIKGTIHAKDKVEINSNGRVFGTIISPKLIIEEGAYLEASCQTSDKVPSPAAEVKPVSNKESAQRQTS